MSWLNDFTSAVVTAGDSIATAARLLHTIHYADFIRASDDTLHNIIALRRGLGLPAHAAGTTQIESCAGRWPMLPNIRDAIRCCETAMSDAAAAGRMDLLPAPPADAFFITDCVGDANGLPILSKGGFLAVVILDSLAADSPWCSTGSEVASICQIPAPDAPREFPKWLSRNFTRTLPIEIGLSAQERSAHEARLAELQQEAAAFQRQQTEQRARIQREMGERLLIQLRNNIGTQR